MPLYDFLCSAGHRFERMVPLAQFEELQNCACGAAANRLISAPLFSVDKTGYTCPITGGWVGSKREHEENLKRHNCRVYETGEREANQRARERREADFDKSVEATVEREWEGLSSDQREKIGAELERGGIDLQYNRSTPNVN